MTAPKDLLELGRKAATAYDRPDLAARLGGLAARVADDRARALVVGEFKVGKSELVNALLTARALPTDPHRATTVPTVVTYAAAPRATMVRATEQGTEEVGIDPAALAEHVTEKGNTDNAAGWAHAAVEVPRELLADGLVLVDTPGAGGLGSPATVSTMAELPGAEAVLLVSEAGRELTAPEMELLRTAAAVCDTVVVVLSRIDLHPQWRRVAELDRAHLAAAGLDVPLYPVSAVLRLHGAECDDAALVAESGVDDLAALLTEVTAGRGRRRARLVADEVLSVCEQLAIGFRSELAVLNDPVRSRELARHLEAARTRIAGLRDRAARWQQTLNDGVADLVSDIEYDLRDRLRAVVVDAEAALEATDPAKTWDQFAPWLHQQVSSATSTSFVYTEERTQWLAERVAAHFAEDGEGVLPPLVLDDAVADPVELLTAPDHEKFGFSQSLLVGMRGSYGGVLMIGMMTTVAGMALLNPFSVGAGLLLGSKTLLDERKRALRRRQNEAKTAVRRHVDDVTFQVGKNSRDMLREVQRTLRDHFTRTAAELDRSLATSAAAASAAEAASGERERRRADLEAELERVETLAENARTLRAATAPQEAAAAARPERATALIGR